ncbi:MAG: SprT family zinc-dependent metalloprotease [Thiotrichaceae bacterium]
MNYKLELSAGSHCQYRLIQSVRAKYIRIKISPVGEVSVVVPKKVNNQLAHDFVEQRKSWVTKCLQEIKDSPTPEIVIPKQLYLQLIDEYWQIEYEGTEYNGVLLEAMTTGVKNTLLLQGMIGDKELVFDVLEQWLKVKAKATFPEMLMSISAECNLPYNRLTIRGQKTRWGSCSAKQNINLNYKLLFFPKEVVRYVFIHELCHTKEMNHSNRFWSLVQQFDLNYRQHRLALKDSASFLPAGF